MSSMNMQEAIKNSETSNNILGNIFGLNGTGADAISGIGEMMNIFNLTLFTVAVGIVMFTMVKHWVQAATDGEYLTKSKDGFFIVKTVLALALLFPVQNGFNLIQMGFSAVTYYGIEMANKVWNITYQDYVKPKSEFEIVNNYQITYPTVRPAVLGQMFKSALCMSAINDNSRMINESDTSGEIITMKYEYSKDSVTIHYTDDNTFKDVCGSVSMTIKNVEMTDSEKQQILYSFGTIAGKAQSLASEFYSTQFNNGLSSNASKFNNFFKAEKSFEDYANELEGFKAMDSGYKAIGANILKAQNNSVIEEHKKLNAKLNEMGASWFFAGMHEFINSLYQLRKIFNFEAEYTLEPRMGDSSKIAKKEHSLFSMSGIIDSLKDLGDATVNRNTINGHLEILKNLEPQEKHVDNIFNNPTMDNKYIAYNQKLISQQKAINDTTGTPKGGRTENYDPSLLNIKQDIKYLASPEYMTIPNKNTINSISKVGSDLVEGSIFMVSTGLASSVAGEVMKAVPLPLAGGAFSGAGSILIAIGSAMFFVGFMLAFYVPFILVINWLSALLQYIVLFVQGFISAPLLALTFIDDNDGLTGQQSRHGIIYFVSMFLLPTLMIFGLLIAIQLINIFLPFIIGFSILAFNIMFEKFDSWLFNNVLMFVLTPLIVYVLSVKFIQISMSLMHSLPENVMMWFGGQKMGGIDSNAMEQSTNQYANAQSGAVAYGANKAGGVVAVGANKAGAKVAEYLKDRRNKKKQEQE